MLSILLKKQLAEKLSALKKGKGRVDYLGALITLILSAGMIAICVIVLSRFVSAYSEIRINEVRDIISRQFELLTIFYAIILLLGIISGIKQINHALFEGDDRAIFSTLPIKSSTVFYSKLITVYIKQLFIYLITLVPVNLTFAVVTEQGAYYVLMTIVICIFVPVLSLAIASIFCLPVYFVKRFFKSKYVTTLIFSTVIVGLLFWCYSTVLAFIESLMTTGDIRFFFKEQTMSAIISAAAGLYPANVGAKILLKINAGANIGIFLASILGFAALGYFIVSKLFYKAELSRALSNGKFVAVQKKVNYKMKPTVVALMNKEFFQIIRTPSYAFQYFSVAAVMPLMVYFCMGIGTDLLSTLIMTESNFELALFLILIFGALTNTFCATNISREGNAFYTLKTLPVAIEKVVAAKILFCSIVAALCSLITCVLVAALHYVSPGEAAFIYLISSLLAEAQICFATRKDLNHPVFPSDDDCEVKESSSTISEIIIMGFLTAIVLGGVSLYLSIYRGSYLGENSSMQTMLFTGLTALAVLAAAVSYLMIGLKSKCYRLTEGD